MVLPEQDPLINQWKYEELMTPVFFQMLQYIYGGAGKSYKLILNKLLSSKSLYFLH